jgi:hypothetical protein
MELQDNMKTMEENVQTLRHVLTELKADTEAVAVRRISFWRDPPAQPSLLSFIDSPVSF